MALVNGLNVEPLADKDKKQWKTNASRKGKYNAGNLISSQYSRPKYRALIC